MDKKEEALEVAAKAIHLTGAKDRSKAMYTPFY